MSLTKKWISWMCLAMLGFSLVAFALLQAIPSQPNQKQLKLVSMIKAWGGRATIHNGLLRGVNLSGTDVSDGDLSILRSEILGLKASRSLREITLSNTHITDAGIANLMGLSSYQLTLHLDCTNISDHALTMIAKDLNGLHNLSLNDTAVTEHGLAKLKEHPTLKTVIVSGPNITDEVIGRLNKPKGYITAPQFHMGCPNPASSKPTKKSRP